MSQKRPISMDNEMHALISFDTRLSVQASHKKDTSVAQQSLISYSCPKYNGTCCPDYFVDKQKANTCSRNTTP